ncbi:retropepsin-like aspartic protease [Poriferisphaera sp. WC338]|uniref:retropepsin-like aspartic protease n=1 Tax=Poriferisphaera sp. WC338 TaxID=3425129 RepID=UPI003D813FD9
MGQASDIAWDQPRVDFQFSTTPTGQIPPNNNPNAVGPLFFNTGLLDTGASGVLLARLSYLDSGATLVNPYQQATNPDTGNPVFYSESGVGNHQDLLDVYVDYTLVFNGNNDTQGGVLYDFNAFGRNNLDFGSFSAIVGMPVMMGKIVNIDNSPVQNLEFIKVDLNTGVSQFNDFSVNLAMRDFPLNKPTIDHDSNPNTPNILDPDHINDTPPTFAPLPFVDGITATRGTASDNGNFIVDTGAQLSMISTSIADTLGLKYELDEFGNPIDPDHDVEQVLQVGGVGGQVDVPFVRIDELILPTTDGHEMVFENVLVGVLDISAPDGVDESNNPLASPIIDGIIGMNLLTNGMAPGAQADNAVTGVTFDFTNAASGTGILSFESNAQLVPEPATLALFALALSTAAARRRRRI